MSLLRILSPDSRHHPDGRKALGPLELLLILAGVALAIALAPQALE